MDEDGKVLAGAVIGLFRTDDGEFTKENALMTTVSAEDGSFSFENIPFGTWYIREIEQPTGFVLNDTVYPVTVGQNRQVVGVEIINKHICGNITLTKVDADYPESKLTGATFEVYKDNKPIGRIDYLHTDGRVRESIEYTNPYSFEKDIKEENYYGVPMSIVLYKDKDGNTIPHGFIAQLDPPPKGFEIIDSPYLPENALDKAKRLIDDFCREEYQREDGADLHRPCRCGRCLHHD